MGLYLLAGLRIDEVGLLGCIVVATVAPFPVDANDDGAEAGDNKERKTNIKDYAANVSAAAAGARGVALAHLGAKTAAIGGCPLDIWD